MISAILRAFWGDLNTPNKFHADPQGAFVNQLGHMAAGNAAAIFLCYVYLLAMAEMPSRWGVFLLIVAVYLVGIEWIKQGWSKADSFIDGGFVALGAAVPLSGLKELRFQPTVELGIRPIEGLAVMAVCLVALAAYVYPRAVRKWRGSQGGGS